MRNDGLKFIDKVAQEEVIFNFHTFCEILKGCISEFCNVSIGEANKSVENCKLFQSPITTVNDVYFFSHEHLYHWAMVCFYGNMYWQKRQGLEKVPESYDNWEKDYIEQNNLEREIFIFPQ